MTAQADKKTLDIYYIDTEGGQSTLFVGPTGESLLVDTGNGGGRDHDRILLAIKDAGVTPELEVFETGHLLLAKRFLENGYVKGPGMFQICLGISWGQPATPEAMTYMRNLLPPGCTWFAFGISLWQFPMVAQAVLLGGHPRVGMEDNIYLEKGKLAPSNAALVEKAGKIIQILGEEIATPADARAMLGVGANA